MDYLTSLSQMAGSGNPIADLVALGIILLVTVILLVAIRSIRRSTAAPAGERPVVAGRLEKIDMTLNSFRTEVLRSVQLQQQELGRVREDLRQVKSHMGLPAERPESEALQPPPAAEEPEEEAAPERIEEARAPAKPAPLAARLEKTRSGLLGRLRSIFSGRPKLDKDMADDVQATLVAADLGPKLAERLMEEVRAELQKGEELDEKDLIGRLESKLEQILTKDAPADPGIAPVRRGESPLIALIVGVNGVGKTTTIAKLAKQWQDQGSKVLMVAADTFRAAAADQLAEWGTRIGVPVISGAEGAKPSTVIFDAMEKTKSIDYDVIIIDTAGRLHTKGNLMQELGGIRNSISRHHAGAPHETILVVDGATGQNAITQAREFNEAAPLTGVIVTKLDGTPKGGVVIAIKDELGIPIRYIGVGETPEDLRVFAPQEFVEAIFEG